MSNQTAQSNINKLFNGGSSPAECVNEVKCDLLSICDKIEALNKSGIRVEFNIVDCKLMGFRALQEMKLSS